MYIFNNTVLFYSSSSQTSVPKEKKSRFKKYSFPFGSKRKSFSCLFLCDFELPLLFLNLGFLSFQSQNCRLNLMLMFSLPLPLFLFHFAFDNIQGLFLELCQGFRYHSQGGGRGIGGGFSRTICVTGNRTQVGYKTGTFTHYIITPVLPFSFIIKDPRDYIGPIQIIQHYHFISGSVS